tara:strand:- start:601 stop:981 length:381 start_codon:yes stop_codon:yes gene_type:complete
MKYINKIKSALLTIYNNIKYISCNDLEYLDDKIHDVSSEINDKCDSYDIDDIIYNNIGDVDNLLTKYDLDDIKEEISALKDDINDNIMNKKILDDSIENLVKKDVLINECIKVIISRLSNLDNDNV